MANSPQLESVKQLFRTLGERFQALDSIDGIRLATEEMMSEFTLDADIVCEKVGAAGVPAEWVTATGAAEDRVLLYLHGGGYIVGSLRGYRVTLSRLSRAAAVRVLGLEYRLAPENPFPAAVEDSVAAYRWLLSQGIHPRKIAIGGDSAGGGLTVATLVLSQLGIGRYLRNWPNWLPSR